MTVLRGLRQIFYSLLFDSRLGEWEVFRAVNMRVLQILSSIPDMPPSSGVFLVNICIFVNRLVLATTWQLSINSLSVDSSENLKSKGQS